jgi:hypothetical protein
VQLLKNLAYVVNNKRKQTGGAIGLNSIAFSVSRI